MKFLLLGILIFLNGCKTSDFSSAGSKKPASVPPSTTPSPPPPQMPMAPLPAPTCTTAGQTRAELLTSFIQNGSENQWITYRLSTTDCFNNPMPLPASIVRFDVYGTSEIKDLDFVLDTTPPISGKLRAIQGTDLFGNKEANFFHHESDRMMVIPPDAIFKIDVSKLVHHSNSGPPYADAESLTTLLRVGNTAEARANVSFNNK